MDRELFVILRSALIGLAGTLLLEWFKDRLQKKRHSRQEEQAAPGWKSEQVDKFLGGEGLVHPALEAPPPAWLRQKSAARRNTLARLGLRDDEDFSTQGHNVNRQPADETDVKGKKKGKRPEKPVLDRRSLRRKWLLGRSQVLGRGNQCDIQILDPAVSLLHALIRFENGQYILYDLGSSVGTTVDEKIAGSLGVPLKRGAMIRLGETVFEFDSSVRMHIATVENLE